MARRASLKSPRTRCARNKTREPKCRQRKEKKPNRMLRRLQRRKRLPMNRQKKTNKQHRLPRAVVVVVEHLQSKGEKALENDFESNNVLVLRSPPSLC